MSMAIIRQRGFTLLEAIVALSVLAMAAMALYGWLNSSLILLKRVDDVYQSIEAVESALEWMSTLDPYEQSEGEQAIAGTLLHWRFVPIGSPQAANDMHGNLSVNDAQLFTAYITLSRDGQQLASFELVRLGLQQARNVEELVF